MNTTFAGDRNQGPQVGSNSGNINYHNYGQPERSPSRPKPSSTVPFRRDPDFVDRGILDEVEKICSKPAGRAALVGLGGVGKSQLAIEYSYRIRDKFPQTWVFWVHASNAVRFEESYRIIANRIGLRRDEPSVGILQLVSDWLSDEANGRWIIILDNADDPAAFSNPRKGGENSDAGATASLSTFLPQNPNGSILVTSRSGEAAFKLIDRHRDIIKVEPMDEDFALFLLEKKLPDGFDRNVAKELLRALDYMPLAISQAAAYISQRAPRITVSRYLDDFRKSDTKRTNLLNTDAGDLRRDHSASNSIITTWQISFEHIRDRRPSAAQLLSLMSFFDRQGIPEFLFHRRDDGNDDNVVELEDNFDASLEDSDMTFEDDVFILSNYSLIKTNIEKEQFEMHRLVQFSTRKWLEQNSELEKWKNEYIGILVKAFPTRENKNWNISQTLFPHVKAALACRPKEGQYLLCWCELLSNAGWYAITRWHEGYLTAEKMFRGALDGTEKELGIYHPDTLMVVCHLALVLELQMKYEAAEEFYRRALNGREQALGKEHPDTLTSVDKLAILLRDQEKYEEAEELSRRALNGWEKASGKEDTMTLTSVDNLALVLQLQRKFEAAEELCRRALSGREKALGKEHNRTLTSVDNLAIILQDQEKYEAAEELIRQALNGREKALGKEHPVTLTSVNNLASVLRDQGKYEAAEAMNRRALDGREKALGKEHPVTLTSVNNLTLVLQLQRKYEAAEELRRRALNESEKKALGRENTNTLSSVENLALVLQLQKKYEAAEELYRRALNGREKALGKEHPRTLFSVDNLALVLQLQRKYEAAEELSRRAPNGGGKALGQEHPHRVTSVNNLPLLLFLALLVASLFVALHYSPSLLTLLLLIAPVLLFRRFC